MARVFLSRPWYIIRAAGGRGRTIRNKNTFHAHTLQRMGRDEEAKEIFLKDHHSISCTHHSEHVEGWSCWYDYRSGL